LSRLLAERRFTVATQLEARTSGKGTIIEGYASVYDVPYEVGGFREIVAPSAFRKTSKESDIRALFNHDPNYPLGRIKSGTLEVDASDPHGWHYRVLLPKNPQAQMVAEAIERGDVTGSSFSFEVYKDDWSESDTGMPVRVLREVRAYDVGPVTFPASEATDVNVAGAMRSLSAKCGRERDYLQRALAAGRLREALAGEWDEEAEARGRETDQREATVRVSKLRQLLDTLTD
jgi:hypothetical protein